MAGPDLDFATLDALGVWVIVLDRRGRIVHANRALLEAGGIEAEKWEGRPVWEVFSLGVDAKAIQQIWADLETRHFPNSYEAVYRRADGTLIRSTWRNTALLDERGQIRSIVGTALGAAVESEPSAMLAESEDRFQALARNASELITELDGDGRFLFVSPNYQRILGHPPEQLLGREALDGVHPEDRPEAERALALLHSEGAEAQAAFRYRHADGGWRWLEASATAYRTSDASLRVIAVARDVTQRRLLEEARTSFGRILEESLNEIFVFDAESLRFIQVNRGARENLGYRLEELRAMTAPEIKPECSVENLRERIEPLRSGRAARIEFETVHRRKDGSLYPVETHLQRVILDDAPVIVEIILDLTERIRAAEELSRAERRVRDAEQLASIGTLAAGLAHDIGTPMNVILGYAEMLRGSLDDADDRERARLIGEQVRRVSDLIQTLLDLARPQETTRVPVDLAGVLEESLGFLGEKLRVREIEVHRHFAAVPDILGDPRRLHQVFLNLFVNAADAMPEGGSLRVHLSPAGADVEVRVCDTGGGIPEDQCRRIFEPFFTTKERGKGTGLGLLVSKGIILDHDGTIDVSSEVGRGTEFRILLPGVAAGGGGAG